MAVHIADAVIPLLLDLEQFEQQIQQVEARIAQVEQRAAQAGAAASQAANQAQAAAGAAQSAASSAASAGASSGGGGGGGFGFGLPSNTETILDRFAPGAASLGQSISKATDPRSPMGSGWSLREDIGASISFASSYIPGSGALAEAARVGGGFVGDSFMMGAERGIQKNKGKLGEAIRQAVDEAINAGKQAAEAESPSRRSMREIGSPIMQGVEVGIYAGAPAVATAMTTSLMFAFNNWKASTFGGTHVGPGLNVVANPGGMLGGGLGGFLGMLGTSIQQSFAIADPQSPAMASRIFMSNIPIGIRDFGQDLLSGLLGSVLPGWAAGPLSDMLGTMFGLKPILQREAITEPGVMAGAGGFKDYPYAGGNILNVTNYFQTGNFTETERAVQIGILQSARRLGVSV